MKRKTVGVDPKLPIQAAITIVAFALSYFGIELSPEVSTAIAVVLGVIVASQGPAAKTVLHTEKE
jgi:hypothetical protein